MVVYTLQRSVLYVKLLFLFFLTPRILRRTRQIIKLFFLFFRNFNTWSHVHSTRGRRFNITCVIKPIFFNVFRCVFPNAPSLITSRHREEWTAGRGRCQVYRQILPQLLLYYIMCDISVIVYQRVYAIKIKTAVVADQDTDGNNNNNNNIKSTPAGERLYCVRGHRQRRRFLIARWRWIHNITARRGLLRGGENETRWRSRFHVNDVY